MGRRHLARELALKVLFALETDGGDAERSLQYHVAESRADAEVADFARTLIQGVRDHQTEIDAHLAEASSNWGLDQMAKAASFQGGKIVGTQVLGGSRDRKSVV